ncbi:hypothetical protein [Streptomyces sp. RKAG293]|uniref:hypothetical protein n=1 Tax=Streptomyces sp. RKAG293 TaxID=2893403 RepID=UPI0020332574|nr:hypothetical protein [Streptomyces sp. RKAG293]MCM2420030.1 hypothetical protein [Streptomyces sp. RKAG293]
MTVAVHEELDVRVVSARPWGLIVALGDGEEGLIDNTKIPAWRDGGDLPSAGTELHVVVLDETRTPIRLSAMAEDWEIARRLRSGGQF